MNKIRWLLPSNENYVFPNIVRMPGTSKMELFVAIVYSWKQWTSVAKIQFLILAGPWTLRSQNFKFSDQRCFNVVDQLWNNVDPLLIIKQNPMSDFQRCTVLIQCRCPMLKQLWNNVDTILSRRCFNVSSTLVKVM